MAKDTSKVNVGTRSKAEDEVALTALIDAETAYAGKELVEKDGMKFIREVTASGLAILTRVA